MQEDDVFGVRLNPTLQGKKPFYFVVSTEEERKVCVLTGCNSYIPNSLVMCYEILSITSGLIDVGKHFRWACVWWV